MPRLANNGCHSLWAAEASANDEPNSTSFENLGPENVNAGLLDEEDEALNYKRVIVSIDFGTTNSAVSYVALEEDEAGKDISLHRVQTIGNYPGDKTAGKIGFTTTGEVPTEVRYPLDPDFRDQAGLPTQGKQIASESLGEIHLADSDDEDSESDDTMLESIDNSRNSFQWGFAVHEIWSMPATHFGKPNKPLSRFKLQLDDSQTTEEVRSTLAPTLRSLRRKKIIRNHVSPIADFLTCLLRHVKDQLQGLELYDDYQMEIVLCVPAIWSQKACRDMQSALLTAMRTSDFKGVDNDYEAINNLFIVSEPEAAATYVLESDHSIKPHDTILLLDAGGGTVDANCLTVSQTMPIRLEAEVVEPGGGLCGSSFLNEAFRKLLQEKLRDETYLEHDQITISGIVENILINEFEYKTKRLFNYFDKFKLPETFYCGGLRDNREKGFVNSSICVKFTDIKILFRECLVQVAAIMEQQIRAAEAKGVRVDKVILVGGFACSKSLKEFLERHLHRISCDAQLIVKGNQVTAVASGGALRALNKERGPRRFARSSYGILRSEAYGDFPEHQCARRQIDPVDGLPWVRTIDWVLKKSVELDSGWTCAPFVCSHTFRTTQKRLLCEEVLYVSDHSTESHYTLGHAKNRGAQEVGRILVDFTFLRDDKIIRPTRNAADEGKREGRFVGEEHYLVSYTMVIKVVGRDLRCYAIHDGAPVKKCRINIASAFPPGTK